MTTPTFPFPRSPKYLRLATIWDYLTDHKAATAAEMGQALGTNGHNVTVSVKLLRAKGCVHICRWEHYTYEATGKRGGGRMAPVYAIGQGPDAKQPRPLTARERDRSWRRRNQAAVAIKEVKRRRAAGRVELVPTWLRGLR